MRKLILSLILTGVTGIFLGAEEAKGVELKQGINGKVLQLTGNQMPGPGKKADHGKALSVPVYIFKGKLKPFEGPAKDNAALVSTLKSDENGAFKAALPPGTYTVVIEYKGKLYLNSFDGQGFWSSSEVKQDVWAEIKIVESSSAAF